MSRYNRERRQQLVATNDPLIGYYGELYFPLSTFPLAEEIPHMTFDGRPYVAASMILRFCQALKKMQPAFERYTRIVAAYKQLADKSLELVDTPQAWCSLPSEFPKEMP